MVVRTGGADGRYAFRINQDGEDAFLNFTGNGMVNFAGGFTHNTTGGYVDRLDVTITHETVGSVNRSAIARAFSISGIAAAYGDWGQNYKNLFNLVSCTGLDFEVHHLDGSCTIPVNLNF